MLPIQKRIAEAIFNIFETSAVRGKYGEVTLIPGDTGHLTFAHSQTTLGSRNLHKMIVRYCEPLGARFAARLAPYLPSLASADVVLDDDQKLHNILRATAYDALMRETQDQFFDEAYWQPAERAATRLGIVSPLGVTVVYDSFVHGSWKTIKDRTDAATGTVDAIGEQSWIGSYVKTRRDWLANHRREDLRSTTYRMDAFDRLIEQGYWALELPLVVRGIEISTLSLNSTPPGCFDGPPPGTRAVSLQMPIMRGMDVRLLQLGLSERGVQIRADGIFGQTSMRLLRQYQIEQGLPATGSAEAALVAELAA
jgi:chitosanase